MDFMDFSGDCWKGLLEIQRRPDSVAEDEGSQATSWTLREVPGASAVLNRLVEQVPQMMEETSNLQQTSSSFIIYNVGCPSFFFLGGGQHSNSKFGSDFWDLSFC
jgi:hypothetical protein